GNRRAHEGAAGWKRPASLSPVGFRHFWLECLFVTFARRAKPMEKRPSCVALLTQSWFYGITCHPIPLAAVS
ncbi:hypothetical protein FP371_25335, partial [Citrobacter freundii]|nr:hypothetical protein [Citrobacter freundii]